MEKVAGVTGLEPATSGVTGQRSNQLSYTPRFSNRWQKIVSAAGHRDVRDGRSMYGAGAVLSSKSMAVF